jgi:hypothetical protein
VTITLDAEQGDVQSLGGPPGQPFEIPLYGSSAATLEGQPANVLVVLSGVAVPPDEALESPSSEGSKTQQSLEIWTEYRSAPSEQLCDATAYVMLASIDNDDEFDVIEFGIGLPHAVQTISVSRVQPAGGHPARIVLSVDPIALMGDVTINRLSYQIHAAIYRPPSGGDR